MKMFYRTTTLMILAAAAFGFAGCLIETETAIKPHAKVDPRVEGVWRITGKLPDEIRNHRDEDGIGVHGYIIIAPMDGYQDTYKALAFDRFTPDTPSKFHSRVMRRLFSTSTRIRRCEPC